jgi:hypothetical protein
MAARKWIESEEVGNKIYPSRSCLKDMLPPTMTGLLIVILAMNSPMD